MNLKKRAENIRNRIIKTHYETGYTHVGSSLSCVEILTVLFFEIMKPEDVFILSPGHKSIALYSTLMEKGILKDIDLDKLGGHPYKNPDIGIHFTTGSLGHGLSLGAGCALAGTRTFVLLSDGDMDEGSTMEAIKFAEKRKLRNLTAIVDCNGWQAYKKAEYSLPLFKNSWVANGHSFKSLSSAIKNNSLVFAKTTKGKGIPEIEDTLKSHYIKIDKKMYEKTIR